MEPLIYTKNLADARIFWLLGQILGSMESDPIDL
jgi:hypothetical protein